jgi:glycosyltransferase involved in cell wall biosynthesis
MMRVALLAWDYPPAPSGLSAAACEIAESLAGEGADVTVFTLDRTGRAVDRGVTIVGLGLVPGSVLSRLRRWGAMGHLAAPLAFRRAVLAAHAERPFAVIESTNWYAPAALLAGRKGLPLVTRNSTPAAFTLGAPATLRDRLDGGAARALERWQVRGSAGLIANTEAHGARMAALYGAEDSRPQAAIGLSLPPDFAARAAAAPYPTEASPVRLLFVGRAERRKGFDLVLAATTILAGEADEGRIPGFTVDLVGVPPSDLPADLPEAARRRISARGRLGRTELEACYRRSHLILAPSRYESFGLVYQEALAYGRPVVGCAEDESACEFIGGPQAGALAGEASGRALAQALRPLIADPALRETCRGNARAAAGRFTRARLGRETLALYALAIAAAGGPALNRRTA